MCAYSSVSAKDTMIAANKYPTWDMSLIEFLHFLGNITVAGWLVLAVIAFIIFAFAVG